MKEILFISYDGLLDPLGRSQILPYIVGLSEKGYKFCVLSYEKNNHKYQEILDLKKFLKYKNIKWYKLNFIKGRYQGINRIIKGAICVNFICLTRNIKLIHLRAIIPGIIYLFSFTNKKFIYDIRSFSGQWVDSRAIKKNSIVEKIIKSFEKFLINNSSGLVILDFSGAKFLKTILKKNVPLKIIPTATNLEKYSKIKTLKNKSKINFIFLGGASFPYLPFEAISFVKQLIDLGFDCYLDLINKGEKTLLKDISRNINFPISRLKIFEETHNNIPNRLRNYDCGLVFISSGEFLKMSSPTKIGEYLAAGLFVLALDGINVTNRLALKYDCLGILRGDFLNKKLTKIEALKIIKAIQKPKRFDSARKLALEKYDIKKALKNYFQLYKKIME